MAWDRIDDEYDWSVFEEQETRAERERMRLRDGAPEATPAPKEQCPRCLRYGYCMCKYLEANDGE